ncbi:hypothetical protein DFH11DRAFT_1547369 [Phellopilus nigrolimitatus]|nr:hypothetical protein DFH11DRAFT_1547369 [Phellopilus nigrolimitatus]
MSDSEEEKGHRVKRFKHQSYNEQLKDIHAPSALTRSKIDEALEDEACLFYGALSHWMQLNLSPTFISFAQKVLPLSRSLPLLVHSWREVTDLWLECAGRSDDEALKALFDLLQKLVEDIRTTLLPAYDTIISQLFSFLPRRISPESLSALLATLLSVFKHLLLPSVSNLGEAITPSRNDILHATWTRLAANLEKCNSEVQRAVAEVWSSVLRRLKKDNRHRCVELMISSGNGMDDVAAWSLVFASKSVAQTLHTCAPTLVGSCLDYYLTGNADELESVEKLLRRLLTALIHHCAKAEQFSPAADQLLQKFVSITDAGCNSEDARRMLNVLAVPCSVRHGSRLSSKQLSQILDNSVKLAYEQTLYAPLLAVTTSALCASSADLAVWMGAGRRSVEHTWAEEPTLAVSLTGTLHESGWKGFSQFAQTPFVKGCPVLLETGAEEDRDSTVCLQVLRVLAKLAGDGVLKSTDDAWRARLATWVRTWLKTFTVSEKSVAMLREIVCLAPLLSSHDVLPSIFSIAQKFVLASADTWADYSASWANETWVFGQLVRVLAKSRRLFSLPDFDSTAFVCMTIVKWSWSDYVMDAIADLAKSWYSGFFILFKFQNARADSVEGREDAVAQLCKNLKSHSHIVRRSSLELLSFSWLCPGASEELIKRCLAAELTPLSVQGVRERVLHIGRVGRVVQNDKNDTKAAELCVAWLLGQLKVSLRPVWTPAAQALAALSERFPDVVWDSVFFELKSIDDAAQGISVPFWARLAKEEEDEINEEERIWRDPSAHKQRMAVAAWTSNSSCQRTIIEEQKPRDRLDPTTYEAQLLVAVGEFAPLAEKHSRELVPLFLSFAAPSATEKTPRTKLANWLHLFSKFSNPKAFHGSSAVHDLFVSILAHPDRALQTTALSCILTYKSPAMLRHADTLKLLLDDTKWRDELTALEVQALEPAERSVLVPVFIRLFFDELTLLVDLMIEPFLELLKFDFEEANGLALWKLNATAIDLPEKQQIGFLMFLADVLKNLGSLVAKSWPRLLPLTITLAARAQQKLQVPSDGDACDVEDETRMKMSWKTTQYGLKRLTEFFRLPVDFNFTPYMPEIFRTVISPRIPLLDRENTQAPSALLDLLDVWSTRPDTAIYLVLYDSRTLTKIYDCLVATNVKPAVLVRIFDMVERMLMFSVEDDKLSEMLVRPYMSRLLANVATLVQRSTESGSAVWSQRHRPTGDCTVVEAFSAYNGRPHYSRRTYETLSHLFQLLRGRQARIALIEVFNVMAGIDNSLTATADLLASLNSFSTTRTEEPDFDRRLSAFATLNEERWKVLSGKEWTPLLHNMLHFIQDENELSIRNNASLSMKRFLDSLSGSEQTIVQACFVRILFPGLKRCLRAKSDLVRSEVMGVLAYAVEKCANVIALQEMRILLAAGDEEANFFNNIFHIQIHRRNRALRRLADYCDEPGFKSSTLQEIFIPVVNSFIAGSGTVDHHLVNEAVLTLGRIAKHLSWSAYFALVQQYIKLATEKSAAERTYTRALVSVLDNFHFSLEDTFVEEQEPEGLDDTQGVDPAKPSVSTKIHDAVNNRLLPTLLKHLEQRDELEETNRIPIAVGIANVALYLPESSRNLQIPKSFVAGPKKLGILRARHFCRIAVNLGPSYLSLVIRLLRGALLRGPHLHVLAFVIHALLVHVTSSEHVAKFDRLDDCVADVVHVSAEVVFGQSGKDIDNEGFKTKMKEVRGSSSKGMNSFAILAKHISPSSTGNLLLPIKAIMQETESAKTMLIVDEVLRRMSVGLNANTSFGPAELLTFCHTLISQNARFFQQTVRVQKRKSKKVNDTVVQTKRNVEAESDHYSHNSWRFVSFGLDLFSTAYRRSRFDFHDSNVMARLEPMVNVIGNTLYGTNGNVVSAGLKAAAQIVKCPLRTLRSLCQSLQTRSTEADVTQTAFKALAVIVRDCSSSQLKEKDLTFLLELLTPDLEEVTRQATAFSLLLCCPEIYDLMDKVREIMVMSQSSQVQELCRSVLLQFLLDYPQGKARLKQHFAFLVKNLSYVFESGRMSVMELLKAIVSKFNDDIIAEYADMLFVALVLVIANDDSTKCRETAAQLIKALVGRMREEQQKTVMAHIHSWAAQRNNPALNRVSSQTYGLVLDTLKIESRPYLSVLLDDVNTKMRDAASSFEEADEAGDDGLDWQTPYQALTTISRVFQIFPDVTAEYTKVSWSSISSLLLYPHAWVRTASCRLLGSLFSISPVNVPDTSLSDDFPLSFKGMKDIANSLSLQLKSDNLDEALGLQIVKNLFYIGKCFLVIPTPEAALDANDAAVEDDEDEDEDDISDGEEKDSSDASNPLPWLFSRLSYQARSAHIARRNRKSIQANWSRQLSAIFRWFAAMASHMDGTRLDRYLPHILSPLYRIAEDDLVGDTQMNELKTLAAELQDLVQAKVGTTKFASVYNQIRQKVVSVRQERRAARVVQTAVDPQSAAKRKMHKNVNKKESRKRKNSDFADHKIRMKFSKRRKTAAE